MKARFLPFVRDPERLVTILNAINLDRYTPGLTGNNVREEFGISPSTPVVVQAGRLVPWKGQDDLIRAAAIVRQHNPDVRFLIVGSENLPGYADLLKQMIAEYQVGEQVILTGYRSDLPNVFAASNICAMPSHEEPFGLVALEAMAMERPVIATRAGGVPEFLVPGEMGILIEPRDYQALANAILYLVNNPELAQTMGRNGRRHVAEYFNDRVYGQKIVATLDEVIEKRRGALHHVPLPS
jgi:glycosyltransferase involved in cell wall biosynthesis